MLWAKLEGFKEAIKEVCKCSPAIADHFKRSGSHFSGMRQAIANAVILRFDAVHDSRLQSPEACLRRNARLLDIILDCSGYRKEM